ncbi:MAG: molecular chaperone DnaJ [Deltaproteobacteria bacterium HGW-Deltaproteobacteria-8]|jgi:curved DNA-binding protein|nr:MAG: molecular chaperone DnaJ [Deltaproteobacteria bacterium HGW-Deltaproteobacteria-8]
MSVEYKDYYKILGVARTATQDEISKAFKKLARKYHPDLNPGNPEAETKFKEMGEANEVLKDPEKRKLYDQLGANWQQGQNFQRPPGFENMHFQYSGGQGGFGGGAGGFSDFFETLFGGAQGGPRGGFGGPGGFGGQHMRSRRGQDAEVTYEIGLEQAYTGGPQSLSLQEQVYGQDGQPRLQTKTLKVNIPPGVKDGQKIRLSGQGSPGAGGGEAGDLYLKIKLAPHPQFKVKDDNVILDLKLAPWEAALGASVRVPTLDGAVEMKIPPGIGSGAKLRVRGKGLGASGRRGDQMVRIMIQSPKELTDEERALWEQLAKASSFAPRD